MRRSINKPAAACIVLAMLAGCGGASSTPATPRGGGSGTVTTAHVFFKNDSSVCAFMSAYWGYTYTPWFLARDSGADPRWLAPRDDWKFDIDYNNRFAGNQDIRIVAEYGDRGNCGGRSATVEKAIKNFNRDRQVSDVDLKGNLSNGSDSRKPVDLDLRVLDP